MRKVALCVALLAVLACSSSASILGLAGGTLPPSTYDPLGGYPMTPFAADGRPLYTDYSDVPSPIAGVVGFSIPLTHRAIGSGWATWSHGYTGDVYRVPGSAVTLTLPLGTNAFYFYAEPNAFSVFNITATAQTGTQLSQSVNGSSGASYYGFWGTAGDTIATIAVTTTDSIMAIGEFGINQTLQLGDLLIEKIIVSGNPPLTDWEFWVQPEDGTPFLVTIAGGGGQDLIEDLEAGVYTVTETSKQWWETAVTSSDPSAIFAPFSATITVPPGGSVTVSFQNSLVPEPCSLTLLGLGVLATLRRRRNRS